MADEYNADQASGADVAAPPPDAGAGEAAQGGDDTFILPESQAKYAQGLKPGDEIIFKVVAIDGDQVQVKYATHEGSEGKGMMDHFDSEVGDKGGGEAPANPGNY